MCVFVPGELIISFPSDERAKRIVERLLRDDSDYPPQMRLLERLSDRLDHADLPANARVSTEFEYWRVQVPPGQEYYKINYLRQRYQSDLIEETALKLRGPSRHDNDRRLLVDFVATPNSLLSAAADDSVRVDLTGVHRRYASMVGFPGSARAIRPIRVAILDTGVGEQLARYVDREVDFIAPVKFMDPNEGQAVDRTGHGTAVATIITDLVPQVRLLVCKVIDDHLEATEFDVIAGLMSLADVEVVNLSLTFLHDRLDGRCQTCGRHAWSSRSIVLERALADLQAAPAKPVVVAAAGNDRADSLAYPARFGSVLAVGSVTERGSMSSFSNYGAADPHENAHANLFFAPGGESDLGRREVMAESFEAELDFWGTSFAAAYASAVVARTRQGLAQDENLDVLPMLKAAAGRNQDMVGFEATRHGNGLLRLP